MQAQGKYSVSVVTYLPRLCVRMRDFLLGEPQHFIVENGLPWAERAPGLMRHQQVPYGVQAPCSHYPAPTP